MTLVEIRGVAWRGGDMPEGLSLAEIAYFQTVRHLSAMSRSGAISQQQVRTDELEARRAAEKLMGRQRYADKTAALWKAIEGAAKEFGTKHDMDSADKFFRTVYGFDREWNNSLHEEEENDKN